MNSNKAELPRALQAPGILLQVRGTAMHALLRGSGDATGSAGSDLQPHGCFYQAQWFFAELEHAALKADALLRKKDRRTARALFAQIKASGYSGGYTRVTDFIRAWRTSAGKDVEAFVTLKFDWGEAFQFDWSADLGFCQEGLVVGGIYHRMQVAHLKQCASRALWLLAYPSQGHEGVRFQSGGKSRRISSACQVMPIPKLFLHLA